MRHGGNIQAVLAPGGFPLWVSEAEPGSVHDITAARLHALPALYHAAAHGLPTLADPGYDGAGIGIHIPGQAARRRARTRYRYPHPQRPPASLRCLGERGFALLNQRWRTLQHITASPSKIGDIARAALVLTHFEHSYIKSSAAGHDSDATLTAAQAPGGSERDGVTHRSPSPDSPEMPCCGRAYSRIHGQGPSHLRFGARTCRG